MTYFELLTQQKNEKVKWFATRYKDDTVSLYVGIIVGFLIAFVLMPLFVYWIGLKFGILAVINFIVIPLFTLKFIARVFWCLEVFKYNRENT